MSSTTGQVVYCRFSLFVFKSPSFIQREIPEGDKAAIATAARAPIAAVWNFPR